MKREKKITRSTVLWIVLAALLITGAGMGARELLANYVVLRERAQEANSTKFYFTSGKLGNDDELVNDYIEGTTPLHEVSDWYANGIQFTLHNYEYITNIANVSEKGITYTLQIVPVGSESASDWKVYLGAEEQTPDTTTGKITIELPVGSGNEGRTDQTVTLKYTGDAEIPDAITVTATTTSPYVTSLTGKFKPIAKPNPEYKLEAYKEYNKEDGLDAYTLTIRTNGLFAEDSANLKVTWPKGVVSDSDNGGEKTGWTYTTGVTGTLSVVPNGEYHLTFIGSGLDAKKLQPCDWTAVGTDKAIALIEAN